VGADVPDGAVELCKFWPEGVVPSGKMMVGGKSNAAQIAVHAMTMANTAAMAFSHKKRGFL
jgi:hypothetical protein